MSIVSRIKAGLSAIGINFDKFLAKAIESFTPTPPGHILTPAPVQVSTVRGRNRGAHRNRKARLAAGLPHGTSGAKLIRRAAEGRIGVR